MEKRRRLNNALDVNVGDDDVDDKSSSRESCIAAEPSKKRDLHQLYPTALEN